MKTIVFLLLLCPLSAFAQSGNVETTVGEAVLALPEGLREGASVLAFGANGSLRSVRQGSGPMVCLSDDPGTEGFHVACYHADLDPFMARGRQLRRQGMDRVEIAAIRAREIEEGKLSMPAHPAALYSLSGPEGCYNAEASTLCESTRLYVVYIPYATPESTGLTTDATRGVPWLMDSGKPWAHIMMIPPE